MALPIDTPMSLEDARSLLEGAAPPEDAYVPEESVPADEIPDAISPLESGKANPIVAGYKDPQMGPFLCANCQYYGDDNSCMLVAGHIEEEGLCNLFTALAPAPLEDEGEPVA